MHTALLRVRVPLLQTVAQKYTRTSKLPILEAVRNPLIWKTVYSPFLNITYKTLKFLLLYILGQKNLFVHP